MAVSEAMRRYVSTHLGSVTRYGDSKQRLVDALYRDGELRLEYDASVTRTAAQAFEARSGNCLALVLMTATFAKQLGLPVHFQLVLGDESWDRTADLYVAVGHVNLTLSDRPAMAGNGVTVEDPLTVDFQPVRGGWAQRTRAIGEATVVAMFLNNRAVESLARGQLDDAYAWTRAAILKEPSFASGYLTLSVIYRKRHHPELAEQALRQVLALDADNTKAMANRVLVLQDLGRQAEADQLAQRLAVLDPHPPYSYFHQGMRAAEQHRWVDAREWFAREVQRAPYQPEFEFLLAIACTALNDLPNAQAHLRRAMALSTTGADRELYASKLARLAAPPPAP